MKLVIKTMYGLEEVLSQEVEKIGGSNIQIMKRSVSCEGNLEFLYKANLTLRTALKILVPVHTFKARNEDQLYDEVSKFDWSEYLTNDQTFAIDNTIFSDFFNHSKYVALKTKDAIVDQFRNKTGIRPSVDIKNPDIQFDVHAYQDQFTISLDASGHTLNRRGYREPGHKAPMNEVLAAGLLILSGWDKTMPLIDPMCGSGTIMFEAALMGNNIAPQLYRSEFGFKNWANYDAVIWNRVLAEARSQVRKAPLQISGGDIDYTAVRLVEATIKRLKMNDSISVRRIPFDRHFPKTPSGMIVCNPPYGERIGENVNELYKLLGDTLKNNFTGFDAWIISSNMEAFKHVKLKASKKIVLFNGPLECKFQKYEMYKGTREEVSAEEVKQ